MTQPTSEQFRPTKLPSLSSLSPFPECQGSDDNLRGWIAAKVEEEKTKQEEEKTRQEKLRLKKREIEQSMLRESFQAGVPPQLIPAIFASTWGAQEHMPLLESYRESRMVRQVQPGKHTEQSQALQSVHQPDTAVLAQPAPAQTQSIPLSIVPAYTGENPRPEVRTAPKPGTVTSNCRLQLRSQPAQQTPNETNASQSHVVLLNKQPLQQNMPAMQQSHANNIRFQEWVPPTPHAKKHIGVRYQEGRKPDAIPYWRISPYADKKLSKD